MKIIFTISLIFSLIIGTVNGVYAEDELLNVSEPTVNHNVLNYSMTNDKDISQISILTALYTDGVLQSVKTNSLNGDFKLDVGKEYTLKIYAWEKGTMKPLTDSHTYTNLKAEKTELTRMLNNTIQGADGTIHYTYYLPTDYDENKSYPMLMTLPGWSSLFNTINTTPLTDNPYADKNAEAWTDIVGDMIIVSPSLTDWGDKSARQTIELTDYFINNFSIDTSRIYAAGHSAGGETLSRVLDMRPELFAAYLHSATQWDGGYTSVAKYHVPIYICMAQNDEYYGSQTAVTAYENLRQAYEKEGLSDEEIGRLLVLDLKPNSYFDGKNVGSYHGGGQLFAYDSDIINWMISRK